MATCMIKHKKRWKNEFVNAIIAKRNRKQLTYPFLLSQSSLLQRIYCFYAIVWYHLHHFFCCLFAIVAYYCHLYHFPIACCFHCCHSLVLLFCFVHYDMILPITIVCRKKDDKEKEQNCEEHKVNDVIQKQNNWSKYQNDVADTIFIYCQWAWQGNLLSHDIRISCYLYKRERQKEYK